METVCFGSAEVYYRAPTTNVWSGVPKIEYTDSISTETHENIVVNQKFSPADFVR